MKITNPTNSVGLFIASLELSYELNRLLLGYFLGFTFGLNIVFSFLGFLSQEEMEMDIQDAQTENQPKAAVSTTSSWRKHQACH